MEFIFVKGGIRLRGLGGSIYIDYLEKFWVNMCRMIGGEGVSIGKVDD